jgi:hypothetical protein
LDREGWDEVVDLLKYALDGLLEIQTKVSERGAETAETILAKVAIIHFRSPPRSTA